MRALALVLYCVAALAAVVMALPIVFLGTMLWAFVQLLCWVELQTVYGGDTAARDKARWQAR